MKLILCTPSASGSIADQNSGRNTSSFSPQRQQISMFCTYRTANPSLLGFGKRARLYRNGTIPNGPLWWLFPLFYATSTCSEQILLWQQCFKQLDILRLCWVSRKGPFKCYIMLFFRKCDTHPSPCMAKH